MGWGRRPYLVPVQLSSVVHPSAKRYRKKNDRVKRDVAAYGRAEILVYLRSVAYLSRDRELCSPALKLHEKTTFLLINLPNVN